MLPYKNLIVLDKNKGLPVYKQISLELILLIQQGKLQPGTVLPSTRSLAFDLEVHRKTIVAAYDVLIAEDWLENLPGKRFTVSAHLPVVKPRSYNNKSPNSFAGAGSFDFEPVPSFINLMSPGGKSSIIINDGYPDPSLLPTNAILKQIKKQFEYAASGANSVRVHDHFSNLTVALHSFLSKTRGIDMGVENLLTTSGAQMAIYIAASLLIKPGDKVVISDPTFFIAETLFTRLGAELIRVPMDSDGMCTDKLIEVLKKHQIKLLYIIPHHHHPTTVTMSGKRRKELLQIINIYNFAVIEDDYDYDFQYKYEPYLPLASGDHGGRIIYIGSLSKVLGSSFRLGYMIATEDFLESASRLRILIDLQGNTIFEDAIASFIENGGLSRHIQKTNKIYAQRCTLLSDLIRTELTDVVSFIKPSGGMALWLEFKPEYDLPKIIKEANLRGLTLQGIRCYKGTHARINAFRFGFASVNEQKLSKAVQILKSAVNSI